MAQNQTQTMTKRDRQLLYGLGLVVLVFILYEICFYIGRGSRELEDEAQQLELDYEAKEMAAMRVGALAAEKESLEAALEKGEGFLFPFMQSYEAERYVTECAADAGLTVQQIAVEKEDASGLTEGGDAALCRWSVSMQLEGAEENLLHMLDAWNNRDSALHIVSYTLQEPYTVSIRLYAWVE